LANLRPRGIPAWWVGVGLVAGLAAGAAAGPMVLSQFPLPGFAVPGDAQLRADLAAVQQRLAAVEKERDSLALRQKERPPPRDSTSPPRAITQPKSTQSQACEEDKSYRDSHYLDCIGIKR
jgi:hypothetical protein